LPDLLDLKTTRLNADLIFEDYQGRRQSQQEWKSEIEESDKVMRGEIPYYLPDGKTENKLHIENTYRGDAKDLKWQMGESQSSIDVERQGNRKEDEEDAQLAQVLGGMYWELDRGDQRFVGRLSEDWFVTGAMFLLSFDDRKKSKYPLHERLDPRNCFPTFFGDELLDLLYCVKIPKRAAALKFPELELAYKKDDTGMADLVYLWTPDNIAQAYSDGQRKYMVRSRKNPLGRVPIASVVEFNSEGRIEVPFIDMKETLTTGNQITGLMVNGTHKAIYPGYFIEGMVDTTEFGPEGEARGASGSSMRAMEPPKMGQEQMLLLRAMSDYSRNTGAFPAQRQGADLPSIISGQGIVAVQGQRESLVFYVRRLMGHLKEQVIRNDWLLDAKALNEEKALRMPAGDLKKYKPADVLLDKGELRFHPKVNYAGGGFSQANRSAVAATKVGQGLMAEETAMALDSDIDDFLDEMRKIERNQARKILFQTTVSAMDPVTQLRFYALLNKGKTAAEAAEELLQTPEQIAPTTAPGTPGPEAAPVTGEEQILAREKGAVGELPDIGPLPPFTNIVQRPPILPIG
jgi:hypothetical protein